MKLTHEPCGCGDPACVSRVICIDDLMLYGVYSPEEVAKLEAAVNLHDELVEALRVVYTGLRDDRFQQFNDARAMADRLGIYHGDLESGERVLAEIAKAVLAKLDKKG